MQSKTIFTPKNLVLMAMFTALMAIGANISSFLVIGSVPITMQTTFSMLAGALLGSRLGAMAMVTYIAIGLTGVPIFAQFKGGLGAIMSPTFGFLLSFVLVAFVTGLIIEKSTQKNIFTFFFACFSSLLINYIIGIHYMYVAFMYLINVESVSYNVILLWMVAPFIKDVILTIITVVVVRRIYSVVQPKLQPDIKKAVS